MSSSPTSGDASLTFDLQGAHVINQGESYLIIIDVENADGTAFVFGANLVRAQIRASKNLDSQLLADFAVLLDDPDVGSITLSLDAIVTGALADGVRAQRDGEPVCIGWYDVEIFNPGDTTDVPARVVQGRVFLDLNVTAP